MSTFCNVFKIAQAFVEKLKTSPLFCYQTFNTGRTSFISNLHRSNKAPLLKNGLPPLFLESLVELMTLTYGVNASSPLLLHISLTTLSTPMDLLVMEREMGKGEGAAAVVTRGYPLQPEVISTIKMKGKIFTSSYEEVATAMEYPLS